MRKEGGDSGCSCRNLWRAWVETLPVTLSLVAPWPTPSCSADGPLHLDSLIAPLHSTMAGPARCLRLLIIQCECVSEPLRDSQLFGYGTLYGRDSST